MAERKKFGKINYYVCSRNVVFKDENQECFYDNNVYFEAYNKYNLKEIITRILNDYNLPNVAIQMEVFGDGVQKRDYSLKNEHQIRVFHIVSNGVKFPDEIEQKIEECIENKTYEQELTEDLISIIHYFTMKSYSHRRKLNKLRKDLETENNFK